MSPTNAHEELPELESALSTAVGASGAEAFYDRSLAFAENEASHAMWAVGDGFVDVSWADVPGSDGYQISRDGKSITTTAETAFRDIAASGEDHEYRISTTAPKPRSEWSEGDEAAVAAGSAEPRTGFNWVLFTKALAGGQSVAEASADLMVEALANGASRILWSTFIDPRYVDIPPVGCEYSGSNYKFKGDDRTWVVPSRTMDNRYRVYTKASVWWSHPAGARMVGGDAGLNATHVVDSSGMIVASKTATDWSASTVAMSSENQVSMDIRTNFQARNPFCITGAIAGNYNATVTKAGSYAIGGEHRGAPNHEIYVYGESSLGSGPITTPSTAYRREVVDFACLIGAACPLLPIVTQGHY